MRLTMFLRAKRLRREISDKGWLFWLASPSLRPMSGLTDGANLSRSLSLQAGTQTMIVIRGQVTKLHMLLSVHSAI